mmetsp:Transcript_34621/g.52960  ORF Transcript_34621/g.52960 Transcript_34621/m.52960 type:complete len:80 (+) Transcript_34621:660-899(+)
MDKKYLTRMTVNMEHIENSLTPQFRIEFMKNPMHAELLAYLNKLNAAFLGIVDHVCSYRVELGASLEKLVESYNSIYLQ